MISAIAVWSRPTCGRPARRPAGQRPSLDAGPKSIRGAVEKAREALGPIAAVHWNAYGGEQADDLAVADPAAVRSVFDAAIVGLLAAVQEALPDLKDTKGAVLVTNGSFGDIHPGTDELAVNFKAMGLALANAAKHKIVGLLAQRLEGDGIYVGEVMVAGRHSRPRELKAGSQARASGAAFDSSVRRRRSDRRSAATHTREMRPSFRSYCVNPE